MAKPIIEGRLGFFFDGGTNDKWIHNGADWIPWVPASTNRWKIYKDSSVDNYVHLYTLTHADKQTGIIRVRIMHQSINSAISYDKEMKLYGGATGIDSHYIDESYLDNANSSFDNATFALKDIGNHQIEVWVHVVGNYVIDIESSSDFTEFLPAGESSSTLTGTLIYPKLNGKRAKNIAATDGIYSPRVFVESGSNKTTLIGRFINFVGPSSGIQFTDSLRFTHYGGNNALLIEPAKISLWLETRVPKVLTTSHGRVAATKEYVDANSGGGGGSDTLNDVVGRGNYSDRNILMYNDPNHGEWLNISSSGLSGMQQFGKSFNLIHADSMGPAANPIVGINGASDGIHDVTINGTVKVTSSITVVGKGRSDATVASDHTSTLTTKGYVDGILGSGGSFLPLGGGTMVGSIAANPPNDDDFDIYHPNFDSRIRFGLLADNNNAPAVVMSVGTQYLQVNHDAEKGGVSINGPGIVGYSFVNNGKSTFTDDVHFVAGKIQAKGDINSKLSMAITPISTANYITIEGGLSVGSVWGGGVKGNVQISWNNSSSRGDVKAFDKNDNSAKLHLEGSTINLNGNSTIAGTLNVSGVITTPNVVDPASERKFKSNIIEEPYGLETVELLKPRQFNYKGEEDVRHGFVVDEIEQIIPEAVITLEDNDDERGYRKTVDMVHMVPMLVKAIQELKQELKELKDGR